jgi:type VI secretion system protein ImpE
MNERYQRAGPVPAKTLLKHASRGRSAVSASDLFHGGKLKEAIAAGLDDVRNHPVDAGRRLFLAEMLCFAGEFERADNHLDAVGHSDPKTTPWIVAFRQLIRAAQARQDFFEVGRLPDFLAKPEGATSLLLEASIRVRDQALADAARLLDQAEESRPKPLGTCDGQSFHDFRDLDDQTSCVLEVLTTNGAYYWIPIAQIESVEFHEPTRPRDLIWRRTHLIVNEGPDGEVYIPVLYPGAHAESDDLIRLGRQTDWRGGGSEPVRGVGQRTFLVGDEARSIMELKSITFAPAGSN